MDDYKVKGVPADMSEADFLAVLRAASSPVSAGEARAVYSYCLARQVSPAWTLAVFHHESTYGRAGTATETHSWGNTRRPSFGVPDIGIVAGRSGYFSKYANWADGGVSTVARVVDYKPYAEAFTVRQITPIWAPSSDGNNTERYIQAVLADIEKWTGGTPMPALDLPIREAIIPASNANRPGRKLWGGKPAFVTVHETSNYSVGADAEMHRKFVANGGGEHGVSFHYVVDDTEAIHLIPDDEVAWHAGDGSNGPGNNSSIAIETCVNADGDWSRTRRNLAVLTAKLCLRHGLDRILVQVVQHNHWSGKNCPLIIRRDGAWPGQLAATEVAYRALTQPAQGGIYAAHSKLWQGGIYAAQAALWG
jgi:N-acetylmuramoyl-L-alanine amidase